MKLEVISKKSNKYAVYKQVVDNDNVVVRFDNNQIITMKGYTALILNNTHFVFLKGWQIQPFTNYYEEISGSMVSLNRNFFKPLAKNEGEFEGFFQSEENLSFDNLLKIAQEQEAVNLAVNIYN